jgi:hypothetical protein
VTLSKITTLYFFFALLHVFVLGGLQIASHITNYNANGVLEAIRSKAYVKGKIIPIITQNDDGSGDTLRICDGIPQANADQCVPIFDAPPANQPQKPKQEQGAATTTFRDIFSDLSDALYAPQTTPTGANRVLNATPSAVTTSGATQPVVSATALNLLEGSPPASSNGKPLCLLAALSWGDKAVQFC